MRALVRLSAVVLLIAAALPLASQNASAAVSPKYDFAPIALTSTDYADVNGNYSEGSSTKKLAGVAVWGWRSPGTALSASLLDPTGKPLRSIDDRLWARTRSSFSVYVPFDDLCAGGYLVRVAVANDPARFDERAIVVPATSTATCTMANAPSPQARQGLVLESSFPALFIERGRKSLLRYWANRYDRDGKPTSRSSSRASGPETATLAVEASNGRVRRVPGVRLQPNDGLPISLPAGPYRFWLETREADGTVMRSNSQMLGVYRLATTRTFTGKTILRTRGHVVHRVVVRLSASLGAPPPALVHGVNREPRAVAVCIRVHGAQGLVKQKCSHSDWTVGRSVDTKLVLDGRVRGKFVPGTYEIETEAGLANRQQIDGAEVDRWTTVKAVDRS